MVDLVLSSGLFAFSRHVGVLEALEVREVSVEAVVGTSSGALVGALWLAGMSPAAIARLLCTLRPITWLMPNARPWQGLCSTRRIQADLARRLPATFEDLSRPLAVGVATPAGRHMLLASGPLVPAVAASLSLPRLFAPVELGGEPYIDGGTVDRLGLRAAAEWRPGRRRILHEVERSHGRQPALGEPPALHIKTPRSGATLTGMGAFYFEKEQARTAALAALRVFE